MDLTLKMWTQIGAVDTEMSDDPGRSWLSTPDQSQTQTRIQKQTDVGLVEKHVEPVDHDDDGPRDEDYCGIQLGYFVDDG